MSHLWTCPKCKKRCFKKNIEAHKQSDFCHFNTVWRQLHDDGWKVLHGSWRGLIEAANVPTKREFVRLSGGRLYEQVGEYGLWIPAWANIILHNTQTTRYPRTSRELRIKFLAHLAEHEKDRTAFFAGWQLTNDWEQARHLLVVMIGEKLTCE